MSAPRPCVTDPFPTAKQAHHFLLEKVLVLMAYISNSEVIFLVQMVRPGCLAVEITHAYLLDNSVTYSPCTCHIRIINYPVPISSPP